VGVRGASMYFPASEACMKTDREKNTLKDTVCISPRTDRKIGRADVKTDETHVNMYLADVTSTVDFQVDNSKHTCVKFIKKIQLL
jgi:hypothetical protein